MTNEDFAVFPYTAPGYKGFVFGFSDNWFWGDNPEEYKNGPFKTAFDAAADLDIEKRIRLNVR